MKKRLALISAVALLTVSLTSCKGYSYQEDIMLYINDQPYTTDQLFKSYGLDSTTGVKGYYTVLNNVAVEASIVKDESMIATVEKKVEDFKATAKASAKTNGTTEAEELSKALDTAGFDTIEELEDSYYLEQKTSKAESNYYSDDNYKGQFVQDMVTNYAPYHVKHILVKFDTDATTSLIQGTISATDAKDISNVVTRLAEGETFGSVALTKSEDSSASDSNMISSQNFGDSGIMTTKTSFVSEFKYGIYTYDAFFNSNLDDTKKAAVKAQCFPSDSAVATEYTGLAGDKVYGIPYSAVQGLNFYADKITDQNGLTVSNASAYNYPRNVLFNNYFNNHGLSFVYLDDTSADTASYYTAAQHDKANASGRFAEVSGISDKLQNLVDDGTAAHTTAKAAISTSQKILTDEAGRPILVARAGTGSGDSGYQGVHFIVLQKDPFTDTAENIEKYYTIDKPTSGSVATGDTFVSFIATTEDKVWTSRVNAVKTAIKNALPNLTYSQYEYYLNKALTGTNENKITVAVDASIKTAVDSYVEGQKESTLESNVRSYNTSWQTYCYQIEMFNELSSRIVPVKEGINAFLAGYDGIKAFNDARAKA
ncbi:MAG: hypothetical protein LKJ88_06815 [Bacilli bacterium]|jgi:hypothetical protein|nr:hypothetical protein [Bacilli bacterium]